MTDQYTTDKAIQVTGFSIHKVEDSKHVLLSFYSADSRFDFLLDPEACTPEGLLLQSLSEGLAFALSQTLTKN